MSVSEDRPKPVNQLLAALPESDYQRLAPDLEQVSLSLQQILFESGEPIREIYFPMGAAVSLVATMSDGSTTEVCAIGKEGMVGLPVFLGGNSTISRAIVQIPGPAMKLEAEVFKRECGQRGELYRLLLLYTQARLTQISQTAACHTHHGIEKRLARWLLSIQDCTEQNELRLTQKGIAQMLGVRRASITESARHLQQRGMIRYSRGKITILDRAALESAACECYGAIRQERDRLLSGSS